MGFFAGKVPAGPFYSATQQGSVPFHSGQVAENTPPYTATTVPVTGDAINVAPAGPFYSATSTEPQQQAFGQTPVNEPPYVSTVTMSPVVGTPGLSGTANPNRANEINGLSAQNTGMFGEETPAPSYTATAPNS